MKAFSSIVIRVLMVLRVFQAKIISYEELLTNIITKRHERSPRPPGVDRVQTLAACNRTRHEVRRAFEPVGMSEASKHCTDALIPLIPCPCGRHRFFSHDQDMIAS